ncbi:MAG: TetR/AcrR family transcriptional regulator [Actinobacteria bacterium]|nr:TetR/AcrR family transcriptional regulator [Actinomycetota bacterium]
MNAIAPTRDRLLDVAEALFARHGIDRVTSRQIVEAAHQRNVSAISYHFGSREGLLLEILTRRGGPIDDARARRRAEVGAEATTTDLVACLVDPYVAMLATPGGRSYLRIVAQLRGRFALWRIESDAATTRNLAEILDEIESAAPGPAPRRRERVVAMIMLLTQMVAERARRIDDNVAMETADETFGDDLVAMCTAVIVARGTR